MIKILDCTLRDGGYYTHWDFDEKLVENYLHTMSSLPIEYIELGYRSFPKKQYEGEFCYLPIATLKKCKRLLGNKHMAAMVNLKEVDATNIVSLLSPCIGYIDLIRLAVRPQDLAHAAEVAQVVKSMGFAVATNIMYMSTWKNIPNFYNQLSLLKEKVDMLWMVDSYGAVVPADIPEIVMHVKEQLSCPIGFHGHHNMELAFANSLQAIACGCEIIDSTITGMGRGAGNLKTELLLTYLSKSNQQVDFYRLAHLVNMFQELQSQYGWGGSLPYMISGANSLPQKDIMEMMSKRRYSVSTIVEMLQHATHQQKHSFPVWNHSLKKDVILIGGGQSVTTHRSAILRFLQQDNLSIVFASSKHLDLMNELPNVACNICLVGQEGHRVEELAMPITNNMRFIINQQLETNTYVPDILQSQTFALPITQKDLPFSDSPLSMALQLIGVRKVYLVGFDGYTSTEQDAYNLMQENQMIVDAYQGELLSLLPTAYKNISTLSIYSYE